MITKLNENGNSGIDTDGVTVNGLEDKELIDTGLSEMEIVCDPTPIGGTGIVIRIEPSAAIGAESFSMLSKNIKTSLVPGVNPLPEIVTVLPAEPLLEDNVIDGMA